jgi:hypothetical protein
MKAMEAFRPPKKRASGQDTASALPKKVAPASPLHTRMNWLVVEAMCTGTPPRTRART